VSSLGREYKDPASTLKYTIDFSADLGTATISGASSVAESGLTVSSTTVTTTTTVTVLMTGGTVGETYRVTVTVTTSDGQTLVRSFWVAVRTL
jgi:hypothetical protein